MKRSMIFAAIVSLFFCVALFSSQCVAEGVFAFEETSYQIVPKKRITLKPVAQNINEKLTYQWDTSDKNIASVNKGTVTGVSPGTATITCTATGKSGAVYTATCEITVNTPIKKISLSETKLTLPCYYSFSIHDFIEIEPSTATNQTLVFSEKSEVINVRDDGTVYTNNIGKGTITIKATDGSGVQAKLTVEVPLLIVSNKNITISDPDGELFWYQINGGGWVDIGTSGGVFNYNMVYKPFDDMLPKNIANAYGLEVMKIKPLKAGKGKIVFTINGRRSSVNVEVKHSAVFDSVSYPRINAKRIIKDTAAAVGLNVSATAPILRIVKDDEGAKSGILYSRVDDLYYCYRYDDVTFLTEGQTMTIYGVIESFEKYQSDTGLSFDCAVINLKKIARP